MITCKFQNPNPFLGLFLPSAGMTVVQHLESFEIWGPSVKVLGTLWIYQNICELFYFEKQATKVFNPFDVLKMVPHP